MLSKSQQDLTVDSTVTTAVIFNIAELDHFIVEILVNNQSTFINKKSVNTQFANITLAKQAALDAGATLIYQALENTHGDVGMSDNRFDYSVIYPAQSI